METKVLEESINKKITSIIHQLKQNVFSLKENTLSEREWVTKELKKANLYYKFLFVISILTIGTLLLVSMLNSFEITPTLNNKVSITSILGIIAGISGTFQYKIIREKLKTALYLLDLKTDIENIKNNNLIN